MVVSDVENRPLLTKQAEGRRRVQEHIVNDILYKCSDLKKNVLFFQIGTDRVVVGFVCEDESKTAVDLDDVNRN